jgi:paired amphipathic helix protein Sin3a
MKLSILYCFQILTATTSSQLAVPFGRSLRSPAVDQQPLNMDPVGPAGPSIPPPQGTVMLSDVMGKDRSINIFAGFTRDIESIAQRLDNSAQNSTILAPLNSAVEKLPRKPWEDARDYSTLGTNAYEGEDGQERAQRNLRRFVEAHVVPSSPWQENDKVRTVLGDREVWWENKDGKKWVCFDVSVVEFDERMRLTSTRSSLTISKLIVWQVGSAMARFGLFEEFGITRS